MIFLCLVFVVVRFCIAIYRRRGRIINAVESEYSMCGKVSAALFVLSASPGYFITEFTDDF